MKHLFIINPAAGSRDRTAAYRKKIEEVFVPRNIPYQIEVSAAPGDCARIAREAAETGEEYRIYSCGGDGTMNEIINGIAGYDNVSVTMYAGGSGNDFIRLFNDPDAFRDLSKLIDCKEAAFNLIKCNDQYSLNICSVGLDARIGTDVANYKRLPLLSGFRAYAISAVVNVIRGIARHFVVEIGGERFDEDFTMISICNGRYYGGGFNPVPEADPSDGLLDVLLVKKVSRLQAATVVGKYKDGKYKELPHLVRHIRTKSLKILCDAPASINLDGELMVAKEVEFSVAPHKIRFFYPKNLTWENEKASV
jgi:YegS/Rv2252/BmrU family lipid kinase